MIRVSVLYPSGDDATFDMDYYRTTHMDIVRRTMKPSRIEIDEGQPGQPFVAGCHLFFDSPEALGEAMSNPDTRETMSDIPNFSNTQPQMQVSTVIE